MIEKFKKMANEQPEDQRDFGEVIDLAPNETLTDFKERVNEMLKQAMLIGAKKELEQPTKDQSEEVNQ